MRAITSVLVPLAAMLLSGAAHAACESEASAQAKKLLSFHMGEGFQDQLAFEPPSQKAPIKNPASPNQTFIVLEVQGHVSPRGEYRMRFIYYSKAQSCVLMGQEILEQAKL